MSSRWTPLMGFTLAILLCLVPLLAEPQGAPGAGQSHAAASIAQDPVQVIQFLSRTISWHRQLEAEGKIASRPTDLSFAQEDLHISDQVVRLAFEYARGQAQLQAKQPATPPPSSDDSSARSQRLLQATQQVEKQLQDTQAELQGLRQKLDRTPAAKKSIIESQIAEVQSEIGLLQARRDALQSMSEFVSSSNKIGRASCRERE